MVYSANSDTKQICLRLRRNKQLSCCDDIELRITPLMCDNYPKYRYEYSICGGLERVEIEREPTLTLIYDMFSHDEQGNICFLLDNNFAELNCGRYNATVLACGCAVYSFQIDKRDRVTVSQVIMDNRSDCCRGDYGC